MANTKLSNTYGLDRRINNISSQIETYAKDVREDISGIKEKSIYYSEMTFVGMLTCILLCAVGVGIIVFPDIVLEYLSLDIKAFGIYHFLFIFPGILMLLVGVHGICKMLFSRKIWSCIKCVTEIEGAFKIQFVFSLKNKTVSQMADMIDKYKDEELSEADALDNKLISTVEAIYSRNKLMNKFTLISRIILPIVLYGIIMLILIKGKTLGAASVVLTFVLMIIFSRRLCLLLEYKAGKVIRAIMTIPALVYGVALYFMLKELFDGICFLPPELFAKIPVSAKPIVSSFVVVCVLQVVALVLAVLFQDYYSETKRLVEGVENSRSGITKHRKWYIYYSITLHCILYVAYIVTWIVEFEQLQNLDSVGRALMTGVAFGVIWRFLSPIWPEKISKTIRKFWGVRYSIAFSIFVIVTIATFFLLKGFIFNIFFLTALIALVVSSWIVFTVMQHIWG